MASFAGRTNGAGLRNNIDVALRYIEAWLRGNGAVGDHLPGARLVVTGERSLDEQTLSGKAPAGVAATARTAGVPVVTVSGRLALSSE